MNATLNLEINHEFRKVKYLGYDLRLTPDEFTLITAISKGLGTADDKEILALISPDREIIRGNLAVHVHNINKKAMAVGGRRIIVKRKQRYIFAENT